MVENYYGIREDRFGYPLSTMAALRGRNSTRRYEKEKVDSDPTIKTSEDNAISKFSNSLDRKDLKISIECSDPARRITNHCV